MITEDRLVFDNEAVDRASVDFDWQVLDPLPAEEMQLDFSDAMRGLLASLLWRIERVQRAQRMRAVGVRLLAMTCIVAPGIVLPGAPLEQIARHYGLSPRALSERMATSPWNTKTLRRRKVRRVAQVRVDRHPWIFS